jgi:hypothetical protein
MKAGASGLGSFGTFDGLVEMCNAFTHATGVAALLRSRSRAAGYLLAMPRTKVRRSSSHGCGCSSAGKCPPFGAMLT